MLPCLKVLKADMKQNIPSDMIIIIDDLTHLAVIELLKDHMNDMRATSPIESCHVLDVKSLKKPDFSFFSAWRGNQLLGCAAYKVLDQSHVELKSMKTAPNALNQGVASNLLAHVLYVVKHQDYKRVSLETGSHDFFTPARRLYEKFGFEYCPPFADYQPDPHAQFMTKSL